MHQILVRKKNEESGFRLDLISKKSSKVQRTVVGNLVLLSYNILIFSVEVYAKELFCRWRMDSSFHSNRYVSARQNACLSLVLFVRHFCPFLNTRPWYVILNKYWYTKWLRKSTKRTVLFIYQRVRWLVLDVVGWRTRSEPNQKDRKICSLIKYHCLTYLSPL